MFTVPKINKDLVKVLNLLWQVTDKYDMQRPALRYIKVTSGENGAVFEATDSKRAVRVEWPGFGCANTGLYEMVKTKDGLTMVPAKERESLRFPELDNAKLENVIKADNIITTFKLDPATVHLLETSLYPILLNRVEPGEKQTGSFDSKYLENMVSLMALAHDFQGTFKIINKKFPGQLEMTSNKFNMTYLIMPMVVALPEVI